MVDIEDFILLKFLVIFSLFVTFPPLGLPLLITVSPFNRDIGEPPSIETLLLLEDEVVIVRVCGVKYEGVGR